MPSFSFTPVKKEIKVAKKKSVENNIEVLSKEAIGIVFIDINGDYTVKVNSENYKIHKDCYNTQNVPKIYLQRLSKDGYREIFVRPLDFAPKTDNKHYLPFTVGCEVIGKIIKNKITFETYFYINECNIIHNDPDAKQALQFYKDNYDTIQKNRDLKWTNE